MPAETAQAGHRYRRLRTRYATAFFLRAATGAFVFAVCFMWRRDALLADEIRTRRGQLRRRAGRAEANGGLVRRAQLPGAQLHARRDVGRRRRPVLSLQLRGAGRGRPGRGGQHAVSGRDPVRSKQSIPRPQGQAGSAALDLDRRARGGTGALPAAVRTAHDSRARGHGAAAKRKPPVTAQEWKAIVALVRGKGA